MPGAAGQLKALYNKLIGGTAVGATGSLTGDLSQQIQALIDRLTGTTDLGAFTGSETGSLGEKLQDIKDSAGGPKRFQDTGGGLQLYSATVIPGASAAWGSYAQLVASTAAALYVVGVGFAQYMDGYTRMQFATGAAASEVNFADVRNDYGIYIYGAVAGLFMFPFPFAVAASTRLAVRATHGAPGTNPLESTLLYIKQSDLVAL